MSHLGLKCFLWIMFLEEQSRTWSRRRRWRWSKTRSSPGSSGRADCPSRTGWSRSQLPTIRRWCHKEILNKWSWRRLDSWVVLHLALIIGMLCHALGCEFGPWWRQILFWTQAQYLCFLHDSIFYLIWYYYLSVKFIMWIVKQKIENNFF